MSCFPIQGFVGVPGGPGPTNALSSLDANLATFPATSPAAAGSRNEHPVINFDDAIAESIVFHGVMSNDYSGGALLVDVDWVAGATTGGVTWNAQFERIGPAGQDIDTDSFAAAVAGTSTTSGTSGVVTRTSITFTNAEADSLAAGDAFRMRITRDVGDAGDTLVGDAQLLRAVIRQ